MKAIKKVIKTFTITGFAMVKLENGFEKSPLACETTQNVTAKNAEKVLKAVNGIDKKEKVYVESITENTNAYEMSVDDFIKNAKVINLDEQEKEEV